MPCSRLARTLTRTRTRTRTLSLSLTLSLTLTLSLSLSLGLTRRRAPKPVATDGAVRCSYGGPQVRGVVQGRAAGSRLAGRWEEAEGGPGDLRLTLSSNGLRFDGTARIDGKQAAQRQAQP